MVRIHNFDSFCKVKKGKNLAAGVIDFQTLNFTRPERGIRVSRTLSTSSRIPTDNAVKLNIWKSIDRVKVF